MKRGDLGMPALAAAAVVAIFVFQISIARADQTAGDAVPALGATGAAPACCLEPR